MSKTLGFKALQDAWADPNKDIYWYDQFFRILEHGSKKNPQEYQDVWLPYCAERADILEGGPFDSLRYNGKGPIKELMEGKELKDWSERYPFVCYSFWLAHTTTDDAMYEDFMANPEPFTKVLHLTLGSKSAEETYLSRTLNLLKTGRFSNVQTLSIRSHQPLGREFCEVLVEAPRLPELRVLNINCTGTGDEVCTTLASAQRLDRIEVLEFDFHKIGADGIVALAGAEHLTSLKHLDLSKLHRPDVPLDPKACAALAKSKTLSQLEVLLLGRLNIGNKGCTALSKSKQLTHLKHLDLGSNDLTSGACTAITRAKHITGLERLSLSHNRITDKGCEAIAQSTNLSKLQVLDLSANKFTDKGCIALAQATNLPNLRELNLSYNVKITERGLLALVQSGLAQNLEVLNLDRTRVRYRARLDAINSGMVPEQLIEQIKNITSY